MKLTVGISGASGVNLALKFIKQIPKDIEIFVVFSKSSKKALKLENGIKTKEIFKDYENITLFKDKNIGASLASGSFKVDKMIILPCSSNTLAKCSVGIADSLITRAFSVMLKRKRDYNSSKRVTFKYNNVRKYAKTFKFRCCYCTSNFGIL